MKKYRAIILAGVAVVYAVAAVIFPDVVLPDQELFADILTAFEGTPE